MAEPPVNIAKDIYSQIHVIQAQTARVDFIYHISDIHIHLYKRHQEYAEVFAELIKYLVAEKVGFGIPAKDNTNLPCVCIMTGDILHSKSDLSPECVAITYKFFKDISEVMPLIIIPGNHDLNMNNKNRMDSLTPIICDLPKYNPVHYLNETGIWRYGNLVLAHSSIFDYIIPEAGKIPGSASNGTTKIILFHGRINGVMLYNGTGIQGEENGLTKKVITATNFAGYDMGLFGDIHRHQWLDEARSRAYAGSLIQQNHGEDLDGHGLIKWTVQDRTGQFIPMLNNYGYVTFYLANGNNDYFICEDGINLKPVRTLPKNIRARVLYSGTTTQVQISAFIGQLKTIHNILEYSCQAAETRIMSAVGSAAGPSVANPSVTAITQSPAPELNINNVDYQNQLITELIREQYEDFPPEHIEIIRNLNKEANRILSAENGVSDGGTNSQTNTRTGSTKYKLVSLTFDNLFSYGTGNTIDFTQFKGVVGIVAPNHTGKSAILDIILWTLFDKFPRKGSVKDIINNRRDCFSVKLELDVGVWRYTIEKSGRKSRDSGSAPKTKCIFARRNMATGKIENLEKDNGKQTKQHIMEVFGSYEDMINTNFSIQTNSTGFIDAENTARRKELERILRFDFLTDLAKKANDGFRDKKAVFEHLQKNMPPDVITKMVETINTGERKLVGLETERLKIIETVAGLQDKINGLNRQYNPDIDSQLEEAISNLDLEGVDISAGQDLTGTISGQLKKAEVAKKQLDGQIATVSSNIIKLYAELLGNSTAGVTSLTKTVMAQIKQDLESKKTELMGCQDLEKGNRDMLDKRVRETMLLIKNYKNGQHSKVGDAGWFDLMIAEKTTATQTLEFRLSGMAEHEEKVRVLEEKNANHRAKIEEKRNEIEAMLKAESVPQCMLDLLGVDGIAVKTELHHIGELVAGFTGPITSAEFTVIADAYKKLGWLEGIDMMAKKNIKTQDKISKNQDRIAECRDRIKKYEGEIQVSRAELKKRDGLERELRLLEDAIQVLEFDKAVWLNNKQHTDNIAGWQTELKVVDASLTELVSMDKKRVQLSESLLSLAELELKKKETKAKIQGLQNAGSGLEDLIAKAESNNKLQQDLLQVMNEVKAHNIKLAQINGEQELTRDQLSGYKARLDKMRVDCNLKIETEKMMNLYGVYRDIMKQIPFRLISQVKNILERKVNDLLAVVTNFSVKFDISDSNIDIYLDRPVYEGRPILINNSSGFERFISSLAIRIALMEISQLPSPNFMAIDEGWSCFDNENINNIDVILDHLGQKFEFILTISHLQIIRQHCDIQVALRKDDAGFSYVTF